MSCADSPDADSEFESDTTASREDDQDGTYLHTHVYEESSKRSSTIRTSAL